MKDLGFKTYYFEECGFWDEETDEIFEDEFFKFMAKDILSGWIEALKASDEYFAKKLPYNDYYIDRIVKIISDSFCSNEYEFNVNFGLKNPESEYDDHHLIKPFTICFDADPLYDEDNNLMGYRVHSIFSTTGHKEENKEKVSEESVVEEQSKENDETKESADEKLHSTFLKMINGKICKVGEGFIYKQYAHLLEDSGCGIIV